MKIVFTKKEIKEVSKEVGEIQGLIGRAQGAAMNDRSECRASQIQVALEEAFNKCLYLTEFLDNRIET
jgi:hypothetical protein